MLLQLRHSLDLIRTTATLTLPLMETYFSDNKTQQNTPMYNDNGVLTILNLFMSS